MPIRVFSRSDHVARLVIRRQTFVRRRARYNRSIVLMADWGGASIREDFFVQSERGPGQRGRDGQGLS
jgi:hypothetical protein